MEFKYYYIFMVLVFNSFIAYLLIKQTTKTNFLWSMGLLYGLMGTTIIVVIHIIRFY
jgi:hypothetical protein